MKFSLIFIVTLLSICAHQIDAHFKVGAEVQTFHKINDVLVSHHSGKEDKDHSKGDKEHSKDHDKGDKDHSKDHDKGDKDHDKGDKDHDKGDKDHDKDHDKGHWWNWPTKKPHPTTKKPQTTISSQTTKKPQSTTPNSNPTPTPPPNMVCPIDSCKHIYCKKKTVCKYRVISIKIELIDKIIYNIEILDSFKGLYSGLKNATLEVPKSNKKHKIGLNQVFVFMTSDAVTSNNHITLKQECYNKLFKSLNLEEIAFFGNKPNEYCEKKIDKCRCKIEKCIKRCSSYCIYCDDEESCVDDCKIRCKILSWFYKYKKHARKPRAVFLGDEL